jgi:uncharacterized protein (TIGR03067 family)
MKSIAILSFFVATTFAATPPTFAEEPKGDLAKLQGSWASKVGPNKDIPIILTIKGGAIEVNVTRPGGEEIKLKGEIKVDEKASPKTLDWAKLSARPGEEIPENLGIYKLDGDTLIVCTGGPGNQRPTKFEAGDGGPPNLNTWTRVKETADEKPIKGDLARFQGSWTAKAGDNDEVTISMTVKVNAYTAKWESGDGTNIEMKGELRVNQDATPKTIDFFNGRRNDGEDARDSLGIYAIEGDKIKVCVGGGGEERPTEFKKGDGSTPHILIFTKKKD